MKKYAKWGGIAVGVPLLLIIILSLLLYFPPFQNWAVRQVTAYASEKMNMRISVGHVHLKFPLDLALDRVKVLEPNDSLPGVTDTVADIAHTVADVQLWPLLEKKVMIDELSFKDMNVNTTHFIPSCHIRGKVGSLSIQAHGIDLGREHVNVDACRLDQANISIALSDTVPPDTTPSKNYWKIAINKLHATSTAFALHLPGDTIAVSTFFNRLQASNAYLDLYKSLYTVNHLDWQGGNLAYNQNFTPRIHGLDFNHLSLSELNLKADSFYYCDSKLTTKVLACAFREKSGLLISSLQGPFAMDSTRLDLPGLSLETPNTQLRVALGMDLNAFADHAPGSLHATLHGHMGMTDLLLLAGNYLPKNLRDNLPRQPLVVDGTVGGNLQRLHISRLNLAVPTVASAAANGFVRNLTKPSNLWANLNVKVRTGKLACVRRMLAHTLPSTVVVPDGIGFRGNVRISGQHYATTFLATQGGGSLSGKASINTQGRLAYQADIKAHSFPIQHFLPRQGLHPFTGAIAAKGIGTDLFSPRTHLSASLQSRKFAYGNYSLGGIRARANISNGRINAHIDSHNALVQGTIDANALLSKRVLQGTVSADIAHADLYALHLTDQPLDLTLCGHANIKSDMKENHDINGMASDIAISEGKRHYRPQDVNIDILTTRDTTHAIADCGDFHLNMNGSGGYKRLLSHTQAFVKELQKQMAKKYIDEARLRRTLPGMNIYVKAGTDNLVCRLLRHYGYDLHNLRMNMTSSPLAGLNGTMQIDSLVYDSIQIDTVKLNVQSSTDYMAYALQLHNGKKNPKYIFNALFDGRLQGNATSMVARLYDWKDRLGLRLSLQAAMQEGGIKLHLAGDNPILGYKQFSVNDSNYVFMGADRRVSANMKLKANDGMGIQIYTNDSNAEALQDITVSLHQVDLGDLLSMVPYTPDVTGTLNGDFHLIQTKEQLSISSAVDVANMVYEGYAMGHVGAEFTYMPKQGGVHYVDGMLTQDGREAGTISGTYNPAGNGYLDATMNLQQLPLDLANGFIPEKIIGLKGTAEGELTVKGSLNKPVVNGELLLDSASLYSEPYGVEFRFADDPVTFKDSKLLFENFEVFAHNDQPLNVEGTLDFSDLSAVRLNTRMRADNFLLVDSKETNRSEVYGKAYINFYGTMTGLIDNLRVRGKADVLGTTDLKYNLRDTPLTTDNQLEGLAEFTNLSDTTTDVVSRPPLSGLNVDLSVSIDNGAHIKAYLNADHSNYVDAIGGGDMRLQYNAADNVTLRGRYTIGSGEMKYSLPVIPLKTFTIQDGSYIAFNGDPMNPTLSITATEQTKSTVGSDTGSGRVVNFTCGVVVSKTLQDMGLEFTIDAPEDMTIHNQLQSMSKEERGKLAVTMLTTGMYLAEGNMRNFTMNSALSAFLNSQINQISGKALRSLDLSVGIDNSFNGNGDLHTDYSFKFAKRFWNNRLRIVIGGKLSTGADASSQNETFFDNVTFEYRLSPTSNKYLNLFYIRDSYDWLEGSVSKFGGGFLWKRKLAGLGDIFRFKSSGTSQGQATTAKGDSAKNGL